MQWLIDIIKEWVIAQAYATEAWVLAKGYATTAALTTAINGVIAWVNAQNFISTSFVHRTPPGGWDWATGDFTANGNWHDLDCSGIVPAGAKAILFNHYGRSGVAGRTFLLRYPNDPYNWANLGFTTAVAGIGFFNCTVVPCASNRHIEYRLTAVVWGAAYLNIIGWWI